MTKLSPALQQFLRELAEASPAPAYPDFYATGVAAVRRGLAEFTIGHGFNITPSGLELAQKIGARRA